MKNAMLFLFFLGGTHFGFSQSTRSTWFDWVDKYYVKETEKEAKNDTQPKEKLATIEVINGDTIYILYHEEIVVMDQEYKKKYDEHLFYIKRMLPYARLVAQIQHDYDSTLAEMDKRKMRKDFLAEKKDIAWAQFEDKIMEMSLAEGQYLMKLIHRECGSVAYDIIIKYLSGAKTFLLQAASRLGGADLKLEYDPEGEDKMIEEIMQKVDKGEIKVRKLTLDPKAVEKKEAAEAKAKEQKKAEKKKNKDKTQKKSGTK